MSSSYRLSLERWLSQLDVEAGKVLDIGGAQLPVKGRTKSWDVGKYLIADLPVPHAASPKPDVELDLNEHLGGRIVTFPTQHNLIFCLEVFDYIWHAPNAMQNISSLLEPDGIAYVTFQSVYPLHQPVEDDALRFMPAGIQKLADYAGLRVVEMIPRRPETNLLTTFYSAERLRAAKHRDHNIMGWIVEFKKGRL